MSVWSTALITGIVVFVLQRAYDKSFLEPIVQFNQNIGKLKAKLSFYERNIANPILLQYETNKEWIAEYEKCSDDIRMLWAEVNASYLVINRLLIFRIPLIGSALRLLYQIPKKNKFNEAMSCLVRISNSLFENHHQARLHKEFSNVEDLETVYLLLKI